MFKFLKYLGVAPLSFAVTLFFANFAAAQQVPASADASRIPETFKEQPAPKSRGGYDLPNIPLQAIPDVASTVTLTLTNLSIEGSTVYDQADFLPLYQNLIGKQTTLAAIFNVANAITIKYRNDGYVLTRAVVPAQSIKDGRVTIRVIEGYVSDVVIRGDDSHAHEKIAAYADKITRSRPLNISALERYLLFIRDIPGYHVESLLKPGTDGAGSSQLLLDVSYDPFEASYGFDNFGTKYLGPWQSTFRVAGNSTFGRGDGTVLRYIGTDAAIPANELDLRYADFSHTELVGSEGTSLTVAGSKAVAYPGSSLKQLNVKTKSVVFSVELNQPIIRTRRLNLSTGVQMAYLDTRTTLLGDVVADDHIRSMRLKSLFDYVDNYNGINQVNVELSQGVGFLGGSSIGSSTLSRAGGRPDFTKVTFDAARLQRLSENVNLYAAVAGQYSKDILLASEEFGIGGSIYGRGYDPSEITGDKGIAGKMELQYSRTPHRAFLDGFQLFAYYDIGKVFQNEETINKSDSLASAGVGTRFNINNSVSGTWQITKPLTRPVASLDPGHQMTPRIFFSLAVRY